MTQIDIGPTIYCTCGEHANHYNNDVVIIRKGKKSHGHLKLMQSCSVLISLQILSWDELLKLELFLFYLWLSLCNIKIRQIYFVSIYIKTNSPSYLRRELVLIINIQTLKSLFFFSYFILILEISLFFLTMLPISRLFSR